MQSFLFRVSGRNFTRDYPERVHPRKRRVPNPDVRGVKVAGDDVKQDMLATETSITTDHYNGYPAILVRLNEVDREELEHLVTSAWKCVAAKHLVASYRDDR